MLKSAHQNSFVWMIFTVEGRPQPSSITKILFLERCLECSRSCFADVGNEIVSENENSLGWWSSFLFVFITAVFSFVYNRCHVRVYEQNDHVIFETLIFLHGYIFFL
jgi:hypothetical protein